MSQHTDDQEEPFDLLGPLDETSGPARQISSQQAAALVQGALAGAFAPPPTPTPTPPPRHILWSVWVTGAGLALAGAVAIGFWWGRQTAPLPEPAPHEVEVHPAPSPPTVPEASPPPPVEPPVAVEPASPAPAPRPAPRAAVESEDLLRRANERRAEGQWQAAESLYLRVLQSSPGTESAYVALVASGGLRVDHLGDARGAVRQYQQALRLRPRGSLSEEARQGLAKAWRALGDTAQEARALEDFLQAHPDSLRAESARRRLSELSAVPK